MPPAFCRSPNGMAAGDLNGDGFNDVFIRSDDRDPGGRTRAC
ncbi:MAG: hypothetical protein K0U29_03440 [Gammaproteobacteria bacterium]|nr:hypothetical protein [Gammaproteobacteria bacterium]